MSRIDPVRGAHGNYSPEQPEDLRNKSNTGTWNLLLLELNKKLIQDMARIHAEAKHAQLSVPNTAATQQAISDTLSSMNEKQISELLAYVKDLTPVTEDRQTEEILRRLAQSDLSSKERVMDVMDFIKSKGSTQS